MKPTVNIFGGTADEPVDWQEIVKQQVGALRFGIVQIVVHDGRVTQIEKTERVRLENKRKN